jgi:hypothetical protein
MAKAHPNPITHDHYAAFGLIIRIVADIDGPFGPDHHCNSERPTFDSANSYNARHKDKMDYIDAMAKISTLSPITANGLEKLISRVRGVQGLRNQIAHSGWIAGRRSGAIKPVAMRAHGALKLLGVEHNEKGWTLSELRAEAKRYEEVGTELALFMKRYGLIPRKWRKSSGRKSRKSQSRGG